MAYFDTNNIVLGGRLSADPEIKTINGKELVKFRLCVNNGTEEGPGKNTLFIDCEWWEPGNAVKYLEKGKKVEIVGRIMMSHWADKNDGTQKSKPFVSIMALQLKGSKKQEDAAETIEDFASPMPF